ncbi:MAG: hypothetical protein JO326_00330 [Acetobacteraceae bacterium]|nr:hypothetical protein [Acetobacteraceae bacterium]
MRKQPADNHGIVGPVSAEVLSVGAYSRAVKTVYNADTTALRTQLEALRHAIDALGLSSEQRDVVEQSVAGLRKATDPVVGDKEKATTHLRSLCDKLKMVGGLVGDAAAIVTPIRQIAEALQVPLHAIGIG